MEEDAPSRVSGNSSLCLRIGPLLLLICNSQVSAAFHQDVEGTCFVAVVDVEKDFTTDLHIAIVPSFTIYTQHAVNASLERERKRT